MNLLQASSLFCLAALIGCTASNPVRIPASDGYEMSSGPYHIAMKSGDSHKASRILVSRDSAFFRDQSVPIAAIRSIETRTFSPLKTAGLVAATGAAAFVLFLAYVVVFIIPGSVVY